MLKSFYVKNFKSWKNDVYVDMTATSISEHPSNVVETKRGKLLKNLVIYGANASGKSNLMDAFNFVHLKVMEIHNEQEWNKQVPPEIKNNPFSAFLTFQRPECATYAHKKTPSLFEMTFVFGDDEYAYGFEMKEGHIINEWLDKNNKAIYDRKKQQLDKIKDFNFIIDKVPDDRLYLSYIIAYAKMDERSILFPVTRFFKTMQVLKDIEKLDPIVLNALLVNLYTRDRARFERMNDFFEMIDFGIKRMEYDASRKSVYFIHQSTNKETFSIFLPEESLGTRKILILLMNVLIRLKHGGLIISDEITSSLHPLLSKLILDAISNERMNTGHAQIVFTTHDIFFLRKEQFRRDEIAFVHKDENGISDLVKLCDVTGSDNHKIRKDATYYKDYLRGVYEGVPNIDYDLFVNEDGVFYGEKQDNKTNKAG